MKGRRRLKRNPGFGKQTDVLVASGKSLEKVFSSARQTGRLMMPQRGMTEFPSQIFNLSDQENLKGTEEKWWECAELTAIDVSHNEIKSIPGDIGSLGDLRRLTFSYNALTDLPEQLGMLENLVNLKADHNKLTKLSEKVFAGNQDLSEVWLQHNEMSSVPSSLCRLPHIQVLDLSNNRLRELPDVSGLRNMHAFKCSSNLLESLPRSVSDLKSLKTMEMAENRLTEVPDLSRTQVVSLDIRQNRIQKLPRLPETISTLHASQNSLKSVEGVESLPALTVLTVGDNSIEKLSPKLGSVKSLKILDVSNNNLSTIPGEIGLIDALNTLLFSGNPLRAFKRSLMSAEISAVKKYLRMRIAAPTEDQYERERKDNAMRHLLLDGAAKKSLSLKGKGISEIPAEVLGVEGLRSLDLSENKLQRVPIEVTRANPNLHTLLVEKNSLSVFPPPVAGLQHLQELNMRMNMLESMPAEVSFLGIVHLDLRNNRFTSFPPAVLSLKKLQRLYLGHNGLTKVPFLGGLGDLHTLDLGNNKIESIEDGLRKVPKLQNLNLENNNIRRIPLELAVCTELKNLQVSGNPFRMLKYSVIQRGTEAILKFLYNKIPEDSPLLQNAPSSQPTNSSVDTAEMDALKREIEELNDELGGFGVSSVKKYALKKKIALKRATLIRMERKAKSNR